MKYPVVEYESSLWLVIYIDGDDYTVCITKNGDVGSIGMAAYGPTMEKALKDEGFNIVKYQTIKEFLEC